MINDVDEEKNSFSKLTSKYFYVPNGFDEVAWVDWQRRAKKAHTKNNIVRGYTIFTTTDCNARCFYCFEKGQPIFYMSEKTATDVANYIVKTSANSPVSIHWFGGEPLVNINAIDIICNSLQEKEKSFKSSMISNGLLIDNSVLDKAANLWNLKRVQITFDGTKPRYQKIKSYKDAKGDEFDIVLDNIDKLIESGIKVSIRLNQDIYNTPDLLNLVDILSSKFRDKSGVSVYNRLLFDDTTPNPNQLDDRYESFLQLQKKLIEHGLHRGNTLKRKLRAFHCMADNDSSVVITPKGEIGLCEHYSNKHLIGTIYNQEINQAEIAKWKESYPLTQKCNGCPLYPQCIRLKMCPEQREHCSVYQCENKIEMIKHALLQKYNQWKAGKVQLDL